MFTVCLFPNMIHQTGVHCLFISKYDTSDRCSLFVYFQISYIRQVFTVCLFADIVHQTGVHCSFICRLLRTHPAFAQAAITVAAAVNQEGSKEGFKATSSGSTYHGSVWGSWGQWYTGLPMCFQSEIDPQH